jgi:hypothetical protein
MFDIVQAIAERIREQAGEYAEAQARIGARTLAGLIDPFGVLAARPGHPPVARPAAGTALPPPRPKGRRRPGRRSAAVVKPRQRQGRRPTLKVA